MSALNPAAGRMAQLVVEMESYRAALGAAERAIAECQAEINRLRCEGELVVEGCVVDQCALVTGHDGLHRIEWSD